jgi:PBP1b-binding outer membrane lipoprotein LpoB
MARRTPRLPMLLLPLLLLPACAGADASRGAGGPVSAEPAVAARFDRVDLELALAEWTLGLEGSGFVQGLQEQPVVAVLRIANDTSEDIGAALDTLLQALESRLNQSGRFRVVDHRTLAADASLAERLDELGDELDAATIAELGSEQGIDYFIHGRVSDTTDADDEAHGVRHSLFLRCTEVATGVIRYQAQIDLTGQAAG